MKLKSYSDWSDWMETTFYNWCKARGYVGTIFVSQNGLVIRASKGIYHAEINIPEEEIESRQVLFEEALKQHLNELSYMLERKPRNDI